MVVQRSEEEKERLDQEREQELEKEEIRRKRRPSPKAIPNYVGRDNEGEESEPAVHSDGKETKDGPPGFTSV
jgi:hypothetical protein